MSDPDMVLYRAYLFAIRAAEAAHCAHNSKEWNRSETAISWHTADAIKELRRAAYELGYCLEPIKQQEAAE